MRRVLLLCLVLTAAGLGVSVQTAAHADATRDLSVTGVGAAMYPAFDPAIDRYAVTTTDATAGILDVAATPGPGETVTIEGGSTHVTGLTAGQRIKVTFAGGSSPHTYTVMYLPAGFPKLTVTTGAKGSFPDLQPGLIGLTLNTFEATVDPFDAIVDRNGVPVWAKPAAHANIDLKQEPTGEITISRPTTAAGHTGVSLNVLDSNLDVASRHDVVAPLTNTDGHDAVRLPDGSTILIGYEWNATTSQTDATIQKVAPDGTATFTWSSKDYASETMADSAAQGVSGDYAHINSVVSLPDGDIIASFRHLSAAYRIATENHGNVTKGQVIWKFGGKDSDFSFVDNLFPSGPCAQHTVSALPNGHLLVFDNGTDGLCVNPLAPSGPGIARHQTRVTEYALDTVAHTATLVWSYNPVAKYSLFAGSARRMANGDTLIDWASDRNALTTEVDGSQSPQVLWELATPATDFINTKRYASYRAELITALRPRIAAAAADGATVIAGDVVAGGASCKDWRGESLDCTVTGLSGGNLDTTTLGSHTWLVAAQDGAGNTTTSTFHYTVRAPGRQADGLVRKAGSTTWRGSNVYGRPAGQTIRQDVRRAHTRAASWQVQNDGERADAFRLTGTSPRRLGVRYLVGGLDLTSAVVAGTYVTPTLQPGQSLTLTVRFTPKRRATIGSTRTVTMTARSVNDTSRLDQVAAKLTTRR